MLRQRQKVILKFLYDYHIQNGFYPTIREIGDGVSISSTSVVKYNLSKLMEMGYLVIRPGRSRATSLRDKAYQALGVSNTPSRGSLDVDSSLTWEVRRLQSQIESRKRMHRRQIETYEQERELLMGELVSLRKQTQP